MKKIIAAFKRKKVLAILLIIILISFILGVFFPAVLSKSNRTLINSSLTSFFLEISKGRLNYVSAIISSLSNNLIVNLFIWLIGISIIGIPFIFLVIIISGFILGFSFSSILMFYGIRGIVISIVYILPLVINLFVFLITCYYATNFSIMLYNYLFRKKEYSRKIIVSRYIKVLLVSSLILILSSLCEVFLVPNLLKFLI